MQILKKITMLAIFMLALGIGASAQVTVTGSTGADGSYTTLGAAFTAINAGTHTNNNIVVAISANTTETGPAVLNSGAWTSLTINPTADGVTVAGPTATGRGLIELNGADSVTINGDNPNTTGTNRNLTIQNTAANTITYTSVIRIATVATTQTSADNDTIRNLILLGSASGRNVTGNTSTTGSENTTFGIYAGGNGGTTVPTAITSVTTNTAPSGTTINNLLVDNNAVNQAARGVVFNGAVATVSTGVTISNNLVGDQGTVSGTPPYTTPTSTVYAKGIWAEGTTAITVSGNTINNIISYVGTTMTAVEMVSAITNSTISGNTITNVANNGTVSIVKAILISSSTNSYSVAGNNVTNVQTLAGASGTDGIEAAAAPTTSGIIERNKIQTVYNRNTGTFGAYGLNLTAGTGIVIRNNFVSDINMDMTGGGAFSTQFSVHGIRIAGGTNHRIYHNSVNLFGTLLGTPTTSILTSAFEITVATLTGIDVRNNIFSNTLTGGTTSIAHVSIFLPASATSAFTLTLNNNDYFANTTAGSAGIAHVGATYTNPPAGPTTYAGLYTAAGFNPADTTSTTNLRTYTSTLGTATNDNASIVTDPLFVSNTDLHLQSGSPDRNVAANVGVANDIDGQTRPGGNALFDIGADEFDGVAPPANDIAATAIIVPASGASFAAGSTVTPQASFTNVGTATQTNVQVQFSIAGPGGYTYSNTQTIASISPNQTVTVTFLATTTLTATGTYTTTATVLTADQNSANNTVSSSFTVFAPINGGAVNVGTGQTYTSLTNQGGIFAAINAGTVTSNITVNITSDLSGETGAVALNEVAGGFTVTIKPTGAVRTITGTAAGGLIVLNSADNVTIDGALSGGTDRSLTITNTGAGGVIQVASGTNGANNDTIKNVNVSGNAAATITTLGGISSGGAALGSVATSANTNLVIDNNNVQSTIYGIITLGTSAAIKDTGTIIRLNTMTGTGNNRIGRIGIYSIYNDGLQVTRNTISGIVNAESADAVGIAVGQQGVLVTAPTPADVTNALISRNNVGVVQQTNTFSAVGILLASGTTGTNTIVNNFVSGVIGNSNAGDLVAGIYVVPVAGATQNIYYNSVSMTGDRGSATSNMYPSFALAVTADQPVNVVDNILLNTQTRTGSTGTGGESVAFGTINSTFANLTSNYNDLYVAGANGAVGLTGGLTSTAQTTTAGAGVVRTTLADWQTATGKDANSVSFDPLFTSLTDLHIPSNSPVINIGTPIATVTTDFDGQTRPATGVDIGADEFVVLVPGTLALSSATYSVGEAGGTATITVNRTGGTDGAVAVNYALTNGTATGGATCAAGVDYVNTGGTVNFANGQASQTFTVTICNDTVFEGNENFNVTISGAAGGATVGTPSSAVVTILDDEVAQPGVLQFSSATYTVGEAGPTVTLTVNRTGGTDGAVGASYTLANGTATGGPTCTTGVDFINTGGTVSFATGESSKTFTVAICNDTIFEGNETFTATLTSPTGGATLGSPTTATVTIADDEVAQNGVLALSASTYSIGEAGGNLTVTVNRTGGTDGAVAVSYTLGGGTATGGATCAAGVDYVNTGGTVSFANGESVKTFTVAICNDTALEGNETFTVTLASPTGGATVGTPSTAVVTILDDEVAQPGTLQFNPATYSVGEATSTVTLTVTRTGGTDGAVGASYSLANGTATGGATCAAGVDFVNTGGTVSFANGESSKTISVTICNDTVFEGNETFMATLASPTGGATIGAAATATVTIVDDEVAQNGSLQFSAATYTVTEAGPTATITVTRTGGSDGSVSASYATVTGGTATGAAACAAGVDYVNTSGTVTFGAGVTTAQTFTIPICNDTVPESSETVNLALTAPTGGATLGTPNTAVLTITDDDTPVGGPVTVTATAGTASATYNNLTEAAAAINAGTHQGAIVVSINQTITEPGTVVINSTGAGSAVYTSILIRPTADNISDSGATVTGRGLIELNGADNVTIDGDNPNTTGTNRNLTLSNTAANTVTFTSVIRVAVAATIVTSADGNTFRNLNIVGSSTGRNIAAATSTTGSENTTFGIFAGPGASTTDATAAPAAITSVSTSVAAGATATNLVVNNNAVVTAARAVSMNGGAATIFPGLQITGNRIGNQTAGDADQVTAIGITAQGSDNGVISNNLIWVEGYVASSAATHGINVGVNSAFGTFTIERNMINRVRNNNGATWSAFGINLGGSNNHVVQNNFVSGIINDQTAGTGGFGSTFGAYGIRVASGTGHKIYHNSVNLYGAMPGVTSTNTTAAFAMTATTQTGVDVRNNIFSNQITGGNPTGTRNVAVFLPSAGTSAMNLTLNNNAYYVGTDANNRLAQVGTTFGTGEYLVGDFSPTATTPATNFRAYTSTLSAAGTNDNASFASSGPAPFTSNVNLHIPAGTATRLESGGAAVGVTTDIDLETRNATTPDIGADEFAGQPAAANDIAASAFVTPANGATVPTGASFTPQASFLNNGTATQTNVTVRYRITNSANVVVYNMTATIATIAPLQIVTVSFPATTLTAAGTYTIQASAELAGDQNTANDSISGTINAVAPLGGTINVGTGETYTSLTNAGGVFQALNTTGISANTVINITSDLTAETGAVALNQLSEAGAGSYTVTIKPSGAARTISGTGAASNGLIVLNGADRVIFDGSLNGGTDKSLTITNNQTGTSTVIWVRSASATNGSNNNTFKNCIINGATGATATTTAGILTGSSVTIGGDAEAPNNNNTIQNNYIYRVQNSLYLRGGAAAANFDQNWLVADNEMGSVTSTADKNIFRGMLIGNSANFTITRNLVHGIQSTATTTAAMSGIQLGLLLSNGTVTKNNITDIKNISTSGTGAYGVSIIATSTASNVTIANNFVSDVATNGSATVGSNGFGIAYTPVSGGTGFNIYYNSVNLNTNQTTAQTSAALYVAPTTASAGAIDVRDNIFADTQTTGTRYAVYSTAAATVFSTINYNDYFAQNVGFIGGSAQATLANWQAATGQDANSKAVDPLFTSATNLHLQTTSPVLDMGTPITGITDDIDGQTRSTTTPDIGADEVTAAVQNGTLALSASTYTVGEAAGTVTVTVNRTNGTDGAVSVAYTLANGTATGGATCAAGVDFVNTGGTVNFAAGQSSQTFTVAICNDTLVESNETFTVTLANPTGGATLGTPATATVTINDDDTPALPSLTINDVRVVEGNAGTVNAVFTVTLSAASATPVSVAYATANGTATAGSDYVATSGTLNFTAGQTTQTITVVVNGDTLKEANETFFVNLSGASGATIGDNQGVGIIIDDDRAIPADFDKDRRTDYSVFRPSNGYWYVLESNSNLFNPTLFGLNGDLPVPGDYDGDGATDYAVFRPSNGTWYVQRSSDFAFVATPFGFGNDKPVQGDYDGDGKTDIAVFRPSTGAWYILQSGSGNQFTSVNFGISTDVPVQGDYDGDAKTDVAVYRNGVWYVLNSRNGAVTSVTFGASTDKPLVGDFDGDGKADYTVYRAGIWYIFQTLTNTPRAVAFGASTDIPVVGDYDRDGTSDIAVFRPSNGYWYVLNSSNNAFVAYPFGQQGDIPIPSGYQSLQ